MQIAGKTFLSGEYAVLEGGSAIGLATKPYFEFSDTEKPDFERINIHSSSAAGLYLHSKRQKIDNLYIKNGYGVGGFGQSTAEFIYVWLKMNQQTWPLAKNLHLKIYQDYLNLFSQDIKTKPSGADLLTQINSGVSIFKNDQTADVTSMLWPFNNYEVLVFSTGLKIKTHEHLQTLDRKHCRDLVGLSNEVVDSFKNKNSDQFLQTLKIWIKTLEDKGLTDPKVSKIAKAFKAQFSDCVFKPCGALGADVVAIITPKTTVKAVINYANTVNFKYQTSSSDLSLL